MLHGTSSWHSPLLRRRIPRRARAAQLLPVPPSSVQLHPRMQSGMLSFKGTYLLTNLQARAGAECYMAHPPGIGIAAAAHPAVCASR